MAARLSLIVALISILVAVGSAYLSSWQVAQKTQTELTEDLREQMDLLESMVLTAVVADENGGLKFDVERLLGLVGKLNYGPDITHLGFRQTTDGSDYTRDAAINLNAPQFFADWCGEEVISLNRPVAIDGQYLGLLTLSLSSHRIINEAWAHYVTQMQLEAAALAAILFSLWFVLRRALRPLHVLAKATQTFAQGDLAVRVPPVGSPELRTVLLAFNQMAASTQTTLTEREQAKEALEISLKDKTALLMEVNHRVKNNLQVILSLLHLEEGRSAITDTQKVLKAMGGRILTMAKLHESLYRSGTFASVSLGVYLGKLATDAVKVYALRPDAVQLKLNMGSLLVGLDQAISGGLLLNELISNCLKHGLSDDRPGQIEVELQPARDANELSPNLWCLRVRDSGIGLPPDFESRRKTSLGLQLVDDFSTQLGGTLAIDSAPGQGTQFAVTFIAKEPASLVMPI